MSKIIGIREVKFTSKDDGREIRGKSIFATYKLDAPGVGEGCDKLFVSDSAWFDLPYQPKVGDEVSIIYNRYGKVASFLKEK